MPSATRSESGPFPRARPSRRGRPWPSNGCAAGRGTDRRLPRSPRRPDREAPLRRPHRPARRAPHPGRHRFELGRQSPGARGGSRRRIARLTFPFRSPVRLGIEPGLLLGRPAGGGEPRPHGLRTGRRPGALGTGPGRDRLGLGLR